MGDVITAVLAAGRRLTMFVERFRAWEALPGRMHRDDGEWRIRHPRLRWLHAQAEA